MDKVLILLLEYRIFTGLTDIDVANIKSAMRIGAAWWNKRLIYYEPLMSWYTYEYLVSNGFIKGMLCKYREEYLTTITFTTMTNTSLSLHMTTPTVSITYTTTLMITTSSESTTISYSESPIMSNLTTPYTRKTPYTTPPTTMQPCQPVDLYTKEYEKHHHINNCGFNNYCSIIYYTP